MHSAETFKPFKIGETLSPNTTIPLSDSEYTIDFGWDNPKFEFEIGLAAFNDKLNLIDYVYHFRPSGLNYANKHSGNDVPNNKQIIQISLDKIPENIEYLTVILYSENEISFDQAKNIYINISTKKGKIGKCVINKTQECFGLLLGIIQVDLDLDDWFFTDLAEPFKAWDIYASTKNIQRLLIKYSLFERVNRLKLDEKKSDHPFYGEILYRKYNWVKITSKFIYIGLGIIMNTYYDFPIYASIFTYDKSNNLIDIINTNKMINKNKSIIIYGKSNKNTISQAKTDDILLSIDFSKLDNKVSTLTIAINCPFNQNFSKIYDAYIRLFDRLGPDGIHAISEFNADTNLIIMGQFRKANDIWYFEPIDQQGFIYNEKDISIISLAFIKKYSFKLINSS